MVNSIKAVKENPNLKVTNENAYEEGIAVNPLTYEHFDYIKEIGKFKDKSEYKSRDVKITIDDSLLKLEYSPYSNSDCISTTLSQVYPPVVNNLLNISHSRTIEMNNPSFKIKSERTRRENQSVLHYSILLDGWDSISSKPESNYLMPLDYNYENLTVLCKSNTNDGYNKTLIFKKNLM